MWLCGRSCAQQAVVGNSDCQLDKIENHLGDKPLDTCADEVGTSALTVAGTIPRTGVLNGIKRNKGDEPQRSSPTASRLWLPCDRPPQVLVAMTSSL